MQRGDVYYANLDPIQGAETQKTRPVIIVSNNAANKAGALVTVLPVTSNATRIYPFEVKLPAKDTGLGKDSKDSKASRPTTPSRVFAPAAKNLCTDKGATPVLRCPHRGTHRQSYG